MTNESTVKTDSLPFPVQLGIRPEKDLSQPGQQDYFQSLCKAINNLGGKIGDQSVGDTFTALVTTVHMRFSGTIRNYINQGIKEGWVTEFEKRLLELVDEHTKHFHEKHPSWKIYCKNILDDNTDFLKATFEAQTEIAEE